MPDKTLTWDDFPLVAPAAGAGANADTQAFWANQILYGEMPPGPGRQQDYEVGLPDRSLKSNDPISRTPKVNPRTDPAKDQFWRIPEFQPESRVRHTPNSASRS